MDRVVVSDSPHLTSPRCGEEIGFRKQPAEMIIIYFFKPQNSGVSEGASSAMT